MGAEEGGDEVGVGLGAGGLAGTGAGRGGAYGDVCHCQVDDVFDCRRGELPFCENSFDFAVERLRRIRESQLETLAWPIRKRLTSRVAIAAKL